MKKMILALTGFAVLGPVAAIAQPDKNAEVRLAKLEQIVVTSDKAQPKGYTPDAATKALLAEIENTK